MSYSAICDSNHAAVYLKEQFGASVVADHRDLLFSFNYCEIEWKKQVL